MRTSLDALQQEGVPSILAISGEAGIGKSRLLVELCGQAETRRLLVLRGRAAEFERDLPFGVFADAMDDYLGSVDPACLPDRWVPELAGVFPSLQMLDNASQPGLLAERYRTHRAVRALLEHLGAERPLVLVLDDVHWADPASVEALSHLLNHPPTARVLLATAFRPAQAPPPLVTALATATRDGRAQLVELPPLTKPEADELLGPALVGPSREALYRESGGNPFYLEQLARVGGPAASESPVIMNGPEGDLPPLVRAALNSELNDLTPGAHALLEGAAVAGDPFEFDLAALAAELPDTEALMLLDELVDRDLVRATNVPRRYRFRHPILRRAVYNWCGPGWRMTAHGRMAAALKARGFTGAAVAHHVERSAKPGDEEAIAVLIDAASSIMPCIPASAARWYQSALRLLPPGADRAQQRLELQVAAAMALAAAGELEEGHAALLEVLEQLTPGPGLWVGLVAMCAGVEVVLGRLDEGRGRLTRALKALGDETSAEAGVLKLELCSAATFTGDYLQVQALADEILRSNQSVGQPIVAATAACLLAMAEYSMGRTTEADVRLTEAVPLFDALDDAQLADRIDAAMWLAIAEMGMERFEDAIRHLERGIAVSRATGRGQWIVALMHCEALALTSLGRLDAARELAATAVDAGRLAGHAQALTTVLFEQSWAAVQAGDLVTAVGAAEEAVDLAKGFDPGINGAMAGLALARALLESGEAERARDELLAACGGQDLCLLQRGILPTAYEVLASIELVLGRPEAAERWVAAAERLVDTDQALPLERASVLRARAAVLLASGHAERAAELARVAAETAAGSGAPVEAGRARLLLGRALAHAGAREQAIVELERAEADLDSCGAAGYRDQAGSELGRLGRRRFRRTSRRKWGLHSLTVREAEIARLVSAGRTNRQIAKACNVSEKTVERHLTNMYVKLGVSSRAALSSLVARGNPPAS